MARRRRGGGHGELAGSGAERWLLTYADMITLLLALFIILFAMSTIEPMRFEALRRTLSQAFRGQVLVNPGKTLDGSASVLDPNAPSQQSSPTTFEQIQDEATQRTAAAFSKKKAELDKFVASEGLKGKVNVTVTERGIVIRLAGDAFFASGSDQMDPSMEKAMRHISGDLKRDGHDISVEGHTDGAPISTAQFPDNLALSSARARTIYRYLDGHGVDRRRMRAVGYADVKPVVEPPKGTPDASIAKNRRVEIVILAPAITAEGANPAPRPIPSPTADTGISPAVTAIAAVAGEKVESDDEQTPPPPDVIGPIVTDIVGPGAV